MFRSQVLCFTAVGVQVVQLPGGLLTGRYQLPVPNPDGAVALVSPPEVVACDSPVALEDGSQALAGRCWHRLALPLLRPLAAGQLQERWHQVDDVAGVVPQLAAGGDAPGPVGEQRRGDPALVDPGLVPAEGRVGDRGPAGAQAEVARGRAGLRLRVVAVVADHELGAGAVVRR